MKKNRKKYKTYCKVCDAMRSATKVGNSFKCLQCGTVNDNHTKYKVKVGKKHIKIARQGGMSISVKE